MKFWTLSDSTAPTGTPETSHVKNFSIIPDGTQAPAQIKDFKLVGSSGSYGKDFYEVQFKIASGEFKSREVKLKIKCFDDKPTVSDRGINLLKRIYDLCAHKPTHEDAPKDADLQPMIGKVIGIRISEFIGTNSKTGEPTNGNYVSEIHAADKEFETIVGVKLEMPAYHAPVESAFSRNTVSGLPIDNSDIPF